MKTQCKSSELFWNSLLILFALQNEPKCKNKNKNFIDPQTEIHANIKFGASIFGKCRSIPLADHTVHGNSSVLTASDRVTKNGSVQKK